MCRGFFRISPGGRYCKEASRFCHPGQSAFATGLRADQAGRANNDPVAQNLAGGNPHVRPSHRRSAAAGVRGKLRVGAAGRSRLGGADAERTGGTRRDPARQAWQLAREIEEAISDRKIKKARQRYRLDRPSLQTAPSRSLSGDRVSQFPTALRGRGCFVFVDQ